MDHEDVVVGGGVVVEVDPDSNGIRWVGAIATVLVEAHS